MSKVFIALFGSTCLLGVIIYFPKIVEVARSTNGGYSDWSQWSVCTRTCSGGRRGNDLSIFFLVQLASFAKPTHPFYTSDGPRKCLEMPVFPEMPKPVVWSTAVFCGRTHLLHGRTCKVDEYEL